MIAAGVPSSTRSKPCAARRIRSPDTWTTTSATRNTVLAEFLPQA